MNRPAGTTPFGVCRSLAGVKNPLADWEGRFMHSDHPEIRPHRNHHTAERIQSLMGKLMLIGIAVLAVGMIYGIVTTGSVTPSWMH
jgi:hypothetical protein